MQEGLPAILEGRSGDIWGFEGERWENILDVCDDFKYDVTEPNPQRLKPNYHNVERTRNKRIHRVEQGPPKGQQRPEGSHSQNRTSTAVKRQVRHLRLCSRLHRPARRRIFYLPDAQDIVTQLSKVRYSTIHYRH